MNITDIQSGISVSNIRNSKIAFHIRTHPWNQKGMKHKSVCMRACAPVGDQTLTFAPCDLMSFIDNKGALCSSKWLLRAAFYKQRIPGTEITKSVPPSGPEGQFPVLCPNPVCRWPLYTSEPWCALQAPKMKTWQTALSCPFPHSEVTVCKWGSGR
jgi:hypothetical protein